MKRFRSIYRDWVCPIALTLGHTGLVFLLITSFFQTVSGWVVPVFGFTCWAYGCALCNDIIPFFKRICKKSDSDT